MASSSQSTVLSSKLWDRLGSFPACFFFFLLFFFFFVLSGIQAAAMSVCGSESPPYPSKDLTWFQSEAISWTIGTCRSVCVPLIQPSSSSSLQLLSCWTGLKRWTAAGGPPDVCMYVRACVCVWVVLSVVFIQLGRQHWGINCAEWIKQPCFIETWCDCQLLSANTHTLTHTHTHTHTHVIMSSHRRRV